MDNLEKKYNEHYKLYLEIIESVNNTSKLINKFGELPKTGVDNIDNLHYALIKAQMQMIEIFESIKE